MKLVELAYFTEDVGAMAAYYRALLGREPVHESDNIAIFDADGTTILIHQTYTPAEGELPPRDHVAFAVADVDARSRELVAQGLVLDEPPREYDWGRCAYLTDPSGNLIELIQQS